MLRPSHVLAFGLGSLVVPAVEAFVGWSLGRDPLNPREPLTTTVTRWLTTHRRTR